MASSDKSANHSVEAQNAKVELISGSLILSDLPTGFDHPVTVHTSRGKVQLMLLTQHEAENAWKVPIQGHERLLESDDQFFADSQHVFLQSVGVPRCRFSVFPRPKQVLQGENVNLTTETADETAVYNGALPVKAVTLQIRQINEAGKAPPVLLGPSFSWRPHGVATVPSDSGDAARWEIRIPANSFENVSNLFLTVNYPLGGRAEKVWH